MNRTSLATSTAAVFVAGGLVLAASASGTAAPAHRAASHRLTLTAHTLGSTRIGRNYLIQSDKAVRSGTTIGYTANSCTFDFAAAKAHCLVTLARPTGQLRAMVTVDADTNRSVGRIVGGSGAYQGAKGTVTGEPGARKGTTQITLRWTD
jgi:hypothetical protein